MIAVQEATNLRGPTVRDKDNKTMAEVVGEESDCDLRFIIPTKMKALIMSGVLHGTRWAAIMMGNVAVFNVHVLPWIKQDEDGSDKFRTSLVEIRDVIMELRTGTVPVLERPVRTQRWIESVRSSKWDSRKQLCWETSTPRLWH